MKKIKTLSFVLTLPLSYEEWQKVKLDTLFRVCGEASNNLISDRRKASVSYTHLTLPTILLV